MPKVPARVPVCVALCIGLIVSSAARAGASTGVISGTAYRDLDASATMSEGDDPFVGHRIYLFDGGGTYLANTVTDALGRYSFEGLASGPYEVRLDTSTWWEIREEWVPTTTGSLLPALPVQLAGSSTADLGWRRIGLSADLSEPISRYVGPSGVTVTSYTDAVDASAVHAALARGTLGVEAPTVTIRFGYSSTSATTSSVVEHDGVYNNYSASAFVSYVSWLDGGANVLSHEYGHAWSLYHAYITQQDPTLSGYLAARDLAGDARVGTSYAWQPREMIAEDYRQLLGPPAAMAEAQTNTEIPRAADVPGLAEYLSGPFLSTNAPPPEPEPSPAPEPSPSPTASPPPPSPTAEPSPSTQPQPIVVDGPTVAPEPVKREATITFSVTTDARVTVRILDGTGQVVRTIAADVAVTSGTSSFGWDRLDERGRRVKRGTYRAQVLVVSASGSVRAGADFDAA